MSDLYESSVHGIERGPVVTQPEPLETEPAPESSPKIPPAPGPEPSPIASQSEGKLVSISSSEDEFQEALTKTQRTRSIIREDLRKAENGFEAAAILPEPARTTMRETYAQQIKTLVGELDKLPNVERLKELLDSSPEKEDSKKSKKTGQQAPKLQRGESSQQQTSAGPGQAQPPPIFDILSAMPSSEHVKESSNAASPQTEHEPSQQQTSAGPGQVEPSLTSEISTIRPSSGHTKATLSVAAPQTEDKVQTRRNEPSIDSESSDNSKLSTQVQVGMVSRPNVGRPRAPPGGMGIAASQHALPTASRAVEAQSSGPSGHGRSQSQQSQGQTRMAPHGSVFGSRQMLSARPHGEQRFSGLGSSMHAITTEEEGRNAEATGKSHTCSRQQWNSTFRADTLLTQKPARPRRHQPL